MQKPPGLARHTEQIEAHGLKALRLRASDGEALVYLQGGHVASFQTQQHGELLWLSQQTVYQPGKAIRGGIPLCFPWFGAHPSRPDLPAHGFARTHAFAFQGSEERGDAVVAELTLELRDAARLGFPHSFRARVQLTVGAELSLSFELENLGEAPLDYELALHTYLGISDIRQVEVLGLSGAHYDDKVSQTLNLLEGSSPLRFVAETDRVYTSRSTVSVVDPGRKRRLVVAKQDSNTTVVWNPWLDKAKRMSDFGDNEWPQMLCIESANTGQARVRLEPGARHATATTISAEDLA